MLEKRLKRQMNVIDSCTVTAVSKKDSSSTYKWMKLETPVVLGIGETFDVIGSELIVNTASGNEVRYRLIEC